MHKRGAETTLDFRKPEKKTHIKYNNNSGLPVKMQLLNSESLEPFFNPLYIAQGEVSKSELSEIGFPMTLTSGAFLNQKNNKQTSHE